jgi:hypothetical protein
MIESITLIVSLMLAPNPRHPLNLHPEGREELANGVLHAVEQYPNDWALLLTWGFYESSLIPNSVGKIGEVGYMQVVGPAARLCKKEELEPGSFMCGSYLFKYGREKCGNMYKGLLWYASGRCKGTPRAERIVKFRLRKVDQWRTKIK